MKSDIPYTVLTAKELQQYRDRALQVATVLLETARKGPERPFVDALAFAAALCGLCDAFEWNPKELIALIVDPLSMAIDPKKPKGTT